MHRRCAFPLLPALAITAIAVTGCGGSSKKSTTTTKTATAASSTSSGGSSGGLSTSTPLNSQLAERLFKAEAVSHGLPAAQADKFVTCLEDKFASQGLKTFADASRNSSQTRQDSESCALSVKTGG